MTIVLTDRDRTILRACHEFRLVSNRQLRTLSRSDCTMQAMNRRLARLAEPGIDYLHWPPAQKPIFSYSNKRPFLYALGQAGLRELKNQGVWFPERYGITHANKQLKNATFMEHQLGVVDCYLAFRAGLESEEGYRLIDKQELLETAPATTKRLKYPWRIPTRFRHLDGKTKERGTKPDYTLAIGKMKGARELRSFVFIEFDNRTEDFVRTDPAQSSITGLYLRYADIFSRKLHTKLYGFEKAFRVAIVVAGDDWDRVHQMIGVFQKHASQIAPGEIFLHTTAHELETMGLRSARWLTGAGNPAKIIAT